MGIMYLKLLGAGMLPAAVSVIFFYLRKRTKFENLREDLKQLVIGVAFGVCAVISTNHGVDVTGATANARDAAPLCAGLLFGGQAGIIAGLIGGIHRWFAAYYGAGMYSQVACTVSTIFAGFFAAFIRNTLFDNERVTWSFAGMSAVIMEVIHMTVLFMTHLSDIAEAYRIVKIVTLPMIVSNAFGVAVAAFLLEILSLGFHKGIPRKKTISSKVQQKMLVTVFIAYLATTFFVYLLQTTTAVYDANQLIKTNIVDVENDIKKWTDENLLAKTMVIAEEVGDDGKDWLQSYKIRYDVDEINVADENGVITHSTDMSYIGFDFHSGEQAAEFLPLLGDVESYVQEYQPITFDTSDLDRARKYAGVKLPDGGFVQVGYGLQKFQWALQEEIDAMAENRRIGKTGYLLIVNGKKEVLSDLKGKDSHYLSETGINLEGKEAGILYPTTVYGESCSILFDETEGYYIIGVMPHSEEYETRDINIYINSFMEIIVYAIIFLIIFFQIKQVVVDDIKKINGTLGKITDGDLNQVVEVNSTEEFETLSGHINSTVDSLKGFIEKEKERLNKDLELAKNIQSSSLPSVFPAFPNTEFDIFATMTPAKEVGGDFYDFYMVGEDRLAFLIADVSGKGVPGAMFMMRAKATIKSYAETGRDVNEVMIEANNALCEGNEAGMFVTAWLAFLDIRTGKVQYTSAGHNPPLIYRKDSGYEYIKGAPGFVLAGMEGVRYKVQEFTLNPGDKVYLYTDGVTEATSTALELYGEERLLNYLNAHGSDTLEDTLHGVKADIDTFVGEAEQFDDITMVIMEYKG